MLRRFGLLLVLCLPLTAPGLRAEVELAGERLIPAGDADVVALLGLPYAAPPTGEWRWRAPRIHSPRPGLQDASQFAPTTGEGGN